MVTLRVRWGYQYQYQYQYHGVEKQRRCLKFFLNPKSQQKKQQQRVTVAQAASVDDCLTFHHSQYSNCIHTNKRVQQEEEEAVTQTRLDQWVRDCVPEIVSNIDEAPFLVHIYSDDGDDRCCSSIRMVREKAAAESWPIIRGRWEGGSPTPNGVILVEELEQVNPHHHETKLDCSTNKVWGVLIQGRGLNCTACYILKTCRVQSLLGFCTHFCLVRVECFGENAYTQLKKLWLQR